MGLVAQRLEQRTHNPHEAISQHPCSTPHRNAAQRTRVHHPVEPTDTRTDTGKHASGRHRGPPPATPRREPVESHRRRFQEKRLSFLSFSRKKLETLEVAQAAQERIFGRFVVRVDTWYDGSVS